MTTYYIDPEQGNDVDNGTSENTAKKNIFNLTLVSGDVVLFKCNTVFIASQQYQAPSGVNNILFSSYGAGAKPVWIGNFSADNSTESTIQLSNRQFWTIQNLKILRTLPIPYAAVAVFDIRGASVKDSYLTIQNCDIEGGGDCIRIIDNVNYVKIKNNHISGCDTDAIWMRPGTGTEIVNNTISNYSVGGVLGDGIQMSEGTGTLLISKNKIVMPKNVVKQGIFTQTDSLTSYTIIKSNLVYNSGSATASIAVEGSGEVLSNICIGSFARGISLTSKGDNQVAKIISNYIFTNSTVNSDGIFISGNHLNKSITINNNTVIGMFTKSIYLLQTASGTCVINNNYLNGLNKTGISIGIDNETFITPVLKYNNIIQHTTRIEGTISESNALSDLNALDYLGHPLSTTPSGIYTNNQLDNVLKSYWNPPSIGAYEYIREKAIVSNRAMRI